VKYVWTIAVFVVVSAALGAGVPTRVRADSTPKSDLSTQCEAMAFSAHPASLPDLTAVTNLRHGYYTLCMDRRGIMDPELGPQ
jgi:hypothetical protein